jgi:hypothetical protein
MFGYLLRRIFQPTAGVSIPVEPGQKSAGDRHAALMNFFAVDPKVPFDQVELIEKMVLSVPDLSQALSRTISLGNTGHHIEIEGLSEKQLASAKDDLESFTSRGFLPGGGTDALVNALFRQVIITGAVSVEAVPNQNLTGLDQVVLVPVKSVRFKKQEGRYIPFQNSIDGEILLNIFQYTYIPIAQGEDNPYGIPPFIAAIDAVDTQTDGMANIKNIYKKFGLLGFFFAKKKIPPNIGMSQNEYEGFLRKRLEAFAETFRKNFSTGAMVGYDDVSLEAHSVLKETKEVTSVFNMVEQQLASGLDIDPALLGRTYSTTETYAGVVYHAFLSSLSNTRRLVKRVLERVYYLELVLRGYPVKRVRVVFNTDRELKPQEAAEAEKTRTETVLSKYFAGIIDADTAAKELGYEKATGKPINQNQGGLSALQYEPVQRMPVRSLWPEPVDWARFGKQAAAYLASPDDKQNAIESADQAEAGAIRSMETRYAERIADMLVRVEETAKSSADANGVIDPKKVFQVIEEELKNQLPKQLYEATLAKINLAWTDATKVKMGDRIVEAQTTATERLHNAIPWFKDKALYDYGNIYQKIAADLNQDVLDGLAGIGKSQEEIEARAKKALEKVAERMGVTAKDDVPIGTVAERYRMVVSNAAMKARNFSQTLSYQELNIQHMEIVAVIDQKTSQFCRAANGRIIETSEAASYVEDYLSTDPDKTKEKFKWPDALHFNNPSSSKKFFADVKCKLPPYHPRCRTTVVVATPTVLTRINRDGKPTLMTGDIEKAEKPDKISKERNEIAKEWVDGLLPDELKSKVAGLQKGFWPTDKKTKMKETLAKHWADHGKEFEGIVNSQSAYEALSQNILENFQQVFLYGQEEATVTDTSFGFYREQNGKHLFVAVNPVTGFIKTLHLLDKKEQLKNYMRIL